MNIYLSKKNSKVHKLSKKNLVWVDELLGKPSIENRKHETYIIADGWSTIRYVLKALLASGQPEGLVQSMIKNL